MATANGQVVTVSRDEHEDLFFALPWSHGTLGFVVSIELKIIPAKPFVKLKYVPIQSRARYLSEFRRVSVDAAVAKPGAEGFHDFIELQIVDKETAVLVLGDFDDGKPSQALVGGKGGKALPRALPLNNQSWHSPWWFSQVAEVGRTNKPREELMPTKDYLLRHNRSIFWVARDMVTVGNKWWFRWCLGGLMPPKPSFLKYTTTTMIRKMNVTHSVFEDNVFPFSMLEESLEASDDLFLCYPLLVYPCRIYNHKQGKEGQGQFRAPKKEELIPGQDFALYYDLGVYGVPGLVKHKDNKDLPPFNPTKAYRTMEELMRKSNGAPFLYADTFLTKDEFFEMFDLTRYDKARALYGAEGAFPHLFDKTKSEIDVFAAGDEAAAAFAEEKRGLA